MVTKDNQNIPTSESIYMVERTDTQESNYDTNFVTMVKNAEKRGNYKTVDVNDILRWLNS